MILRVDKDKNSVRFSSIIRDATRKEKITLTYVDEPGKQKLNCLQATAYYRIRYTRGEILRELKDKELYLRKQ